MFILLIHASFSTSSKHLPIQPLIWCLFGIIYGFNFKNYNYSIKPIFLKFGKLLIILITLITTILWFQIYTADILYVKYRKVQEKGIAQSVKKLNTILNICPYHSKSLYLLGYIAFKNNYPKQTLHIADKIDLISPNILKTNALRAEAYLQLKDYKNAELLALKELNNWPNDLSSKVILAKSYAYQNKCIDFLSVQERYVGFKRSNINKITFNNKFHRLQYIRSIAKIEELINLECD